MAPRFLEDQLQRSHWQNTDKISWGYIINPGAPKYVRKVLISITLWPVHLLDDVFLHVWLTRKRLDRF